MNTAIKNLLNNNSIAQLMELSDDSNINVNEVPEITNVLWKKFVDEIKIETMY